MAKKKKKEEEVPEANLKRQAHREALAKQAAKKPVAVFDKDGNPTKEALKAVKDSGVNQA